MLATINRTATRKMVEKYLSIASLYKRTGIVRREMKMNTSYEPRLHGSTNQVGKPVEEIALHNVEKEAYMRTVYDNVMKAIAHLGDIERELIVSCYLSPETAKPDYLLCYDLNVSERTFRRIKARAIMELAFMLGIEVFED
ncbi:ArpU family phage packaging/lysis transcriptional regulator [Paenibacillus sp.]|uniref:ArpU family phage packaging/lysis transcriptional regulator n=1 Tax=Paenibacillus sp. TaxID=58172 RepID=UPI003463E130